MKYLIKALTPILAVDGWGRQFNRFEGMEPGECYLIENSKIAKKLLTQEKLMVGMVKDIIEEEECLRYE